MNDTDDRKFSSQIGSGDPHERAATAIARLAEATREYTRAEEAEMMARKDATHALNLLNEAQKLAEDALAEMRSGAPGRSDWQANRTRAASRSTSDLAGYGPDQANALR